MVHTEYLAQYLAHSEHSIKGTMMYEDDHLLKKSEGHILNWLRLIRRAENPEIRHSSIREPYWWPKLEQQSTRKPRPL